MGEILRNVAAGVIVAGLIAMAGWGWKNWKKIDVPSRVSLIALGLAGLSFSMLLVMFGQRLPTGSVMAFDIESGCPAGWESFSEADGRTIIGIGDGRVFRETGGSASVLLTEETIPRHSHKVYRHAGVEISLNNPNAQFTGAGSEDKAVRVLNSETSSWGNSKKHENMPPFIVLHLCEKV